MSGIVPIPTTRTTGLFTRTRLLQQLQTDQLELFRIQNQLSTGRRINLPSEDAPAALRAITLQKLIERKEQIEVNITTGTSYLAATDTALSDVATKLADIRGAVLGVAGTTSSDIDRQAVVSELEATIDFLLTKANTTFRGRYLFAGSQTDQVPYERRDDVVAYLGNESLVRSYSDLDVLFATNIPGTEVFGGISEEVVGSVDLNPQVTEDTLLSSIQGGIGLSPNGALSISDGSNVSVVDISGAVTLGDVARLIEENPPQGRVISVDVTGQGLTLRFPPGETANLGANLTVTEVASGSAAAELGIFNSAGVGTGDLVGSDLDPVVTLNTNVDTLLGTRAKADLVFPGTNNDISLTASVNGASLDGVTVQLVDFDLLFASPGLTAGNEAAFYSAAATQAQAALPIAGSNNDLTIRADNAGTLYNNVAISITDGGAIGNAASATYVDNGITRTLSIAIDNTGATTIQAIIDELAGNPAVPFTASHDTSAEAGPLDNLSTVAFGDFITNPQPNTGNSGGDANTLFVYGSPGDTAADHVVDAINTEGTFTAALDPQDSTSLGDAGSGLVDFTVSATTTGGTGSELDTASGIQVISGGSEYTIDTSSVQTVQDLLNALNGDEAGLFADITPDGKAIEVRSRLSGGDFQIGENGGTTATQLGIRTFSDSTELSDLNYGVGVTVDQSTPFTVGLSDIEISTSDGQVFNVSLPVPPAPLTVTDVINEINLVTTTNVTAQPDGAGGFELVDNTSGTEQLSVSVTGTQLATSFQGSLEPVDFAIVDRSGQSYTVSLEGASTIGDVIAAINTATGGNVTAGLAPVGNGIRLTDNTGSTASDLILTQPSGSTAAEQLGFLQPGQQSVSTSTNTLTSEDRNYLENDSVFNTLIRLRDALEVNDTTAINRAIESIDEDINRVTFARAEVGARHQGLEVSLTSLEDESVQLQSALSDEIDVDLAQAISDLTSRQIALQASLQTMANLLQLSLLNFI